MGLGMTSRKALKMYLSILNWYVHTSSSRHRFLSMLQFAILYDRGWSRYELAGLAGTNLLRVFRGAELASAQLKHEGAKASMDIYTRRPDLPAGPWEDEF